MSGSLDLISLLPLHGESDFLWVRELDSRSGCRS